MTNGKRVKLATWCVACLVVLSWAACPAQADTKNIFCFGNSAWSSTDLKSMATAGGHTLNLLIMSGDNTAYERAVDGTIDPATGEPYKVTLSSTYGSFIGGQKYFIRDLAAADNWDAAIIDCNTGLTARQYLFNSGGFMQKLRNFSVNEATMKPGARMYAYQHMGLPNDDSWNWLKSAEPSLRTAGFLQPGEIATDDAFARGSSANFDHFTTDVCPDVTSILAGDVLYWARRDAEWGYVPHYNYVEAKALYDQMIADDLLNYPNKPYPYNLGPTRDFWSGFQWNGTTTEAGWQVDFHPNIYGKYLIACTFFETIFEESVIGNSYLPSGMTAEDAEMIQRIVHETLADETKVPAYNAVPEPTSMALVLVGALYLLIRRKKW